MSYSSNSKQSKMEKQPSLTPLHTNITKNTKLRSCMLLCCDYFYDTLSGLISLLDVITDIMILIYYCQTNKQVFFLLSLSILLFAQLSYAMLFVLRFASHLKIRYKIFTFIIILPICPFMSYIFYWASLPNNKLSHFFKYIGLQCSEYEPPSEKQAEKLGITKLQEYFAEKLINHTGFVLEAIFESFPQSVLQCIAMLIYYNEGEYYYNVLTFISILISLISISSKSLMFSGSLNISTFFFNWLCAICDFFGLYLIFVWVFFVPLYDHGDHNNNNDYSLSLFATIWIWKFIICTVSPIVVGTFILSVFIAIDMYDDITLDMYKENLMEYIYKFIIIIGIIIVFAILWSFGVVLLIIFGEILCCTWIAIGFYYYNESRFSHSRTFMKIFYWLYLSNDSSDLLIRLISINYRLSHGKMMNDVQLHKFLTNVIKNDLRFNITRMHRTNNKNIKRVKHLNVDLSDDDPDLFGIDAIPISANVCTTNMLFESADDYEAKQHKQLSDYYEEYEGDCALRDFGTSLLSSDMGMDGMEALTYKSLKDISYKDFRVKCKNKHKTHLISVILKQMVKAINEDKLRICELNQQTTTYIQWMDILMNKLIVYIQLFADYILWFLFVPLYAVSRIFNLLIPIIGLILIPHIKYIAFFQWILTALFFILLIGLIVLFPSVWKFQFLAWHVAPGYSIISPKIHNDNNKEESGRETMHGQDRQYIDDEYMDDDHEYTTTLEEILSDRSSAQQSGLNDANDLNVNVSGPRRARRIRRVHKRQQRKQKKKKLKRIREKIRKYEKLEFYEWVKEFYYKCLRISMVRSQIIDKFGADIGNIILSFLPLLSYLMDDNVIMKEVVDDCEECECESKTFSDSYNDPVKDYYDDIHDNDTNMNDASSFIMDLYSENGNNSNCTHSSLLDNDGNPLLFDLEDNNLISSQQRNRRNTNNSPSLLYYEDLNNLNCNTVNLNELYNNNNKKNTNIDDDIFEVTN